MTQNIKNIYDVIVIGAGASGLFSALFASEEKARVLVLEKTASAGNKLLITGDGRCNFTNENLHINCYHTDSASSLLQILGTYTNQDTIETFHELGLHAICRNGYYYPKSQQSKSVLRVLMAKLMEQGVEFRYEENVRGIQRNDSNSVTENSIDISSKIEAPRFIVRTEKQQYYGNSVILATGGSSYMKTGSSGDGYYYAKKFGHTVEQPVPALVELLLEDYPEELFGIREQGSIQVICKDVDSTNDADVLMFGQTESSGELQFTKTGISGIPTFAISGTCNRVLEEHRTVEVRLDLNPSESEEEMFAELSTRRLNSSLPVSDLVSGYFTEKMTEYLLRRSGFTNSDMKNTSESDLEILRRFCHLAKNLTWKVTDSMGFKKAQVTSGGILLSEIDPKTMESRLQHGLYLTGEILNVDGICGGYNLQFAWSTGMIAGTNAAKGI